jgi:hypothetical protein
MIHNLFETSGVSPGSRWRTHSRLDTIPLQRKLRLKAIQTMSLNYARTQGETAASSRSAGAQNSAANRDSRNRTEVTQ